MPISSSIFPALSCSSFKVSGLIKVSDPLDLILVQSERWGSIFSLLHADIQFCQQYLLKRLSFLYCIFWTPLSNISGYSCMDLHLALFSIGLLVYFCASTMLFLLL
jgi:hypothetical protein